MAAGEVADFKAKRDQALAALTNSRRQRYAALAEVCRQIEQAINAVDDPRVQKLEELMWTFLRLLGIEQSLERFLEIESRENVPKMIEEATGEYDRLSGEVESLRSRNAPALDARERLLQSRGDYLEALDRTIELAPTIALPGHGDPVDDPAGRARELQEHHRMRLEETTAALASEPRTGYELSFALFGDDLKPAGRRFAVAETLSHLERLVRSGTASRAEVDGTVAYTAA